MYKQFACKLKLGDLKGALFEDEFALCEEDNNVKALFRQGQCTHTMNCMRIQSPLSLEKNWKYDVFVRFKGETCFNFTDHLYAALCRQGIVAFKDDTRLEKGRPISAELLLLQAIERSQVLIVVFSISYASSTWCLQELAKIADYIETQGQRVLPVFYNMRSS